MNLPAFYRESLLYVSGIILLSLPFFWLTLNLFKRRNLDVSIRRGNKKLFRKISLVTQLFISIGIAFCSIVILKQIYFLNHTDELGFSFRNTGAFLVYGDEGQVLAQQMKQMPEIKDVVYTKGLVDLATQRGRETWEIGLWDDQIENAEKIKLERLYVTPEYMDFYGFHLLYGEMLTDADPGTYVLLNESAVKAFGWDDPIGKHLGDGYTVKGVIKHVYNFAPTIAEKPVFYLKAPPNWEIAGMTIPGGTTKLGRIILFRYHEGTWDACKAKIEAMKDDYIMDKIFNSEEEYNKHLKSERALLKLLSFESAICVLICIFGFVSLISLTCEERRKEIAIRKINGATVNAILTLFAKEYALLLLIGAVIAFMTGYFIMQRWLEQYVKQTGIPAWVYLSILCVMALVIVICVGWRVYKASTENPAEVVKGE
jgi:hypothetical protein